MRFFSRSVSHSLSGKVSFFLFICWLSQFPTNWVKTCYVCVKLGKEKVNSDLKMLSVVLSKAMKDEIIISVMLTCVAELVLSILLKQLHTFWS